MALVLAISEQDAGWYRAVAPGARIEVLSSVFDYPAYQGGRPPPARPLQLAYLAKMSWWPNREGGNWFARSVLPNVHPSLVEVDFYGPGTEAFFGRAPNLRGHGFVESLDSVWARAHFTICPIRLGSGINIKLTESVYNGVPVLTTPHGCRGLPAMDDPAVMVVAPEDWPAFLASESAMALASASVRPGTRELFSAQGRARWLGNLLRGLA